jgi:LAS superfamily LD-carboxypeptidase LdcB
MRPRHDVASGSHRAPRVPTPRAAVRSTVRAAAAIPPALALVAAAAFVGGGVTSVTVHQLSTERAREAARSAVAVEQANRARSDAASTDRLSGQATAYLAARRTEARTLAAGAVVNAGAVTSASQGVLDPTETAELDEAVAHLATLIDAAPDARVALDDAVTTVAAARVIPVAEPPASSPASVPVAVEPLADVTALVEQSRPERLDPGAVMPQGDTRSATTPTAAPLRTSTATVSDPVARHSARGRATAADTAVPETTTGPAANSDPGRTPIAAAAQSLLASAAPRTVTPATVPGDGSGALLGTSPLGDGPLPAPAAEVLATADLELTASADLAAAAQRVLDLSAQLQATVDERIAARDAAARAQAEAAERERQRLAHETTTQRIKRLVAGAKAAPPGQIPDELLCDVPFDHSVRLRCDAAAALTLMEKAYRAETGQRLTVVSSYRTTDVQTQLFLEKGAIAAAPGTSNHERGQAIDVGGAGTLGQFDAPLYLWLSANAGRFGWHHPLIMEPGGSGPLEPWHWEYDTTD